MTTQTTPTDSIEAPAPPIGSLFHTEIRSADPPATMHFFETAFGWQQAAAPSPVHFILDLPGSGEAHIGPPSNGYAPNAVPYVLVADLDATAGSIRAAGGEVIEGAQETPQGRYLTFRAPGGPDMIAWQSPATPARRALARSRPGPARVRPTSISGPTGSRLPLADTGST